MTPRVSSDKQFKSLVLAKCVDALVAVGFTSFRKSEVDWPLDGGFHCWVGLNYTSGGDGVEISPFTGLHVSPLMKLCAQIERRKYDRRIATYAVHLGLLAPKEPAFLFTRSADLDSEAHRLARLFATIAIDYAMSIGSYERLLPLLQERVSQLGGFPERTACCLHLMGRREDADAFVKAFAEEHPRYFRRFADSFLTMAD